MARKHILILILLLVALGLRVWGLAERNIWWDEGLANWAARLPVSGILHWTAHDVHPPLYFLILRGWWSLVGDGEFVLRFPSALIGVLGVVLVYRLGLSLGGERAGLWAALFFALSRFAIAWSQEMRMYVWAAVLAAGALWAAVRVWQEGDWRCWLLYVGTVAAGLWTLYLMISVPIVANLAFAVIGRRSGRRRMLGRWILGQLAAGALFVPWLIYALPRIPTWSTAEPFTPLFFTHLYATMLAVGVPIDLEAYTPLTLAVFGALAAGLTALWRSRRTAAQMGGLIALGFGLLLPALVVYAVSLPIHVYYAPRLAPRYLLPLSVCFYALLGWGLAALGRRTRWGASLAGLVAVAAALVGLAPFYADRARRDDYVSVAATLRAHVRAGDRVVLHTDRDWPVFAAHYAGAYRGLPNAAQVDEAAAGGLLESLWEQTDAVWLVLTPDAQRNDPGGHVVSWLEARAVAVESWRLGESDLFLFVRSPERADVVHDLAPGFTPGGSIGVQLASDCPLLGAEVPLPRYRVGDTVHLFLYWDPPPDEGVTVRLQDSGGVTLREAGAPVPVPARDGPARQQVDLALTPDLPPGRLRIVAQCDGNTPVEVGRITLLRSNLSSLADAGDITHPLDVQLGDRIQLLGYDLPRKTVEPGEALALTLYWRATAPVEVRYKVFVHLLGQTYNAATGNVLWGQQDNEPVDGHVYTSMWAPGEIVADPYSLHVSAEAPAGTYQIEVGMYGLLDGARLPVVEDGSAVGDHVFVESVEVVEP